ncbi:hypothetical protein FACS1894103_0780 [Campylobacterota bacterium]|nr:hypothetical protein FACS1894103_0780 [Campylobacterota bacterium]
MANKEIQDSTISAVAGGASGAVGLSAVLGTMSAAGMTSTLATVGGTMAIGITVLPVAVIGTAAYLGYISDKKFGWVKQLKTKFQSDTVIANG